MDEEKYVYHGTAHSLLPFIAKHGLDPEASQGATWFHKDINESRRYAESPANQMVGEKRKGALLRIKLDNLPLDAVQPLSYSDITATSDFIPPEHIEHEQPDGSWKLLVNPKADGGSVDGDDITAYHGTPHDFERFDLSKVGSGQGEQAYGHGLYFASNEDVAKTYRDDLSSHKQLLDDRPVEEVAHEGLMADEASPDQKIAGYVSQYGRMARRAVQANEPHLLDRYDELESGNRLRSAGKMYEVRIKAHPETILDWDKPLSEQPRIMAMLQEQHANLDPEHPKFQYLDQAHKNMMGEGSKGAHAHYYLRSTLGNKEASDYLNGMGIKGIKYLDSGSRGVGEGSHNYVIFDDGLVNVARKYRRGGEVEGYAEGGDVEDQDIPYHQTPEFQNLHTFDLNNKKMDKASGGHIATLRRMTDPAVSEAIRVITKFGSSPRDAVSLSKRLLGRQ